MRGRLRFPSTPFFAPPVHSFQHLIRCRAPRVRGKANEDASSTISHEEVNHTRRNLCSAPFTDFQFAKYEAVERAQKPAESAISCSERVDFGEDGSCAQFICFWARHSPHAPPGIVWCLTAVFSHDKYQHNIRDLFRVDP